MKWEPLVLQRTRDRQAAYHSGQDEEYDADHEHRVESRRPNVGHVITVTDGRECHHHEVERLVQVEVTVATSLKILDAADAKKTIERQYHCEPTSDRLFDEHLAITW
jgi:hypothetical protein